MIDVPSLLAVLAGIAARLIIPLVVTGVAVYFLRLLDARWQSEGRAVPAKIEKPACWEIMGCTAESRKTCPGYASALPCWQARRTENGYMRQECLACKVFLKAPAPSMG
jgi:hypothetical protein